MLPPGLMMPPFIPTAVPGMPMIPMMFPLPPPVAETSVVPKEVDDKWFRDPDETEPNETLYVTNINTRVKQRNLQPFLENVCPPHRLHIIV